MSEREPKICGFKTKTTRSDYHGGQEYETTCRLPPPGGILRRHAHCTCPTAWGFATATHHHPTCSYYEDETIQNVASAYADLSLEARIMMPPTDEWRKKIDPESQLKERGPFKTFRVTGGTGTFPVDMLRYDCAWPATEDDSYLLAIAIDPATDLDRRVTITLRCLHTTKATPARWEAYGWRVLRKGEE